MRAVLRRLGVSGALLAVSGLWLWVRPLTRQLEEGWSTQGDLFLLGAGGALVLAASLPRVLRINLAVFVVAIMILELTAAVVLAISRPRDATAILDPKTRVPSVRGHVQIDSDLGYKLAPDTQTTLRRTSDGALVFEMTVTTNVDGRRVIPVPARADAEGFVIFFGDSFTFGEGVNDDQTFPYYVATLLPRFSVYNYGVGGYGPQHLLAILEGHDVRAQTREKYGVGVYTYIDAHVHRVAFTSRSGTSRRSPYYVLDEEGRVVRKKNFNLERRYLHAFYEEILTKTKLYEMFRLDVPPVNDQDIELTCRLIVSAKERFFEQFERSQFVVVFYPGRGERHSGKVKQCLGKHRISYLDYSQESWPDEYLIPYDNHPNAKGHLQFARMIAPELEVLVEKAARAADARQ